MRIKHQIKSLCESCKESQVLKFKSGREITICHYYGTNPAQITEAVESCNCYTAQGKMTDYEAEKIGWVLETGKNKVGFKPPKEKD